MIFGRLRDSELRAKDQNPRSKYKVIDNDDDDDYDDCKEEHRCVSPWLTSLPWGCQSPPRPLQCFSSPIIHDDADVEDEYLNDDDVDDIDRDGEK